LEEGSASFEGGLFFIVHFGDCDVALPEEESQKDDHLRPRRLRRSRTVRNAVTSGEQSLVGGELSGAMLNSDEGTLIGVHVHKQTSLERPDKTKK